MSLRIGLLFSRIRMEEKMLIQEAENRNINLIKIDSRKLIMGLSGNYEFDVLLERDVSHSRALYALNLFQGCGIKAVNRYDVAQLCGDKVATTKALEDANIDNGCLWVAPGGHKGPLRKLFTKIDNVMTLKTLDNTPFEKTTTPLEVKKGSLVMLHGRLPHYSCENTSNKSRHAYTLHVIDGNCKYSSNNWLQRSSMPLQGFI